MAGCSASLPAMAALQPRTHVACCHKVNNVMPAGARTRSLHSSRSSFCAGHAAIITQTRCRRRHAAAHSNYRRLDIQAVIPMLAGDATDQTPPDLPSFLFKERIVYLGMSLVPAVTELLLAEFMYLQYDSPTRPIFLYINSTGVQKGGDKLGYEAEALAIYDTMRYVKPAVGTVCVGSAYGEAALLLAAGEKGKRAALPSATIMIRQPIQRFQQMQASDIDIYRNEIRKTNGHIVELLSKHTEHDQEKIAKDILRPKYFDPHAAIDYNLIDRVLEANELGVRDAVREASKFS